MLVTILFQHIVKNHVAATWENIFKESAAKVYPKACKILSSQNSDYGLLIMTKTRQTLTHLTIVVIKYKYLIFLVVYCFWVSSVCNL